MSTEKLYSRIERLTKLSRGFQNSVVFFAAVEFGIFDLLDRAKNLNSKEVAEKLGLDFRATDIFLHSLAGMELLKVEKGLFRNAPLADELLVRGRAHYQGDIISHNGRLMERWVQLPSVLRTGKPAEGSRSVDDKESRRDFVLGMSNIAGLSAEKVAGALDLATARSMLDLGGGPGTYSIIFCRMNPELAAVVFDLPEVIDEITTALVDEAALSDRITFIRGDYLKHGYGKGYDLVLASNIIHSLGVRQNRDMLGRCYRSMVSGGRIVVKDFLLDEDRVTPAFASMFAVNMLIGTETGGCYTINEVTGWLEEAGFKRAKLVEITAQARMLVAERPD